ncbi:MAG TPA: NAD(P)/FAD-dependent oxidoreductase [Actinospica sp.]|nr:NAD(P)/FAD-dependent oxidoreductase [Actinospica sp.]
MSEIDVPQILEKHAEERAKRKRPEGAAQYTLLSEQYTHLAEDPFTDRVEREPVRDHVKVAVIGAGFAGLMTSAYLKEAGVEDVRLLEAGGDVGGTWYWNRYPGVRCDVASLIYLPLLEETGHMPSEWYASGPEIFEHCQRIAKHYGLYEKGLFHTRVTDLEWDEAARHWIVRTDRGDDFTAQFVSYGLGHLSVPKLPGIPGVEDFAGHLFHSSRWDYAYTGDPEGGPLGNLRDKRVAIIGTGATTVQAVPELAGACRELFVLQRTPSAVEVRNNRPIDPEWFAGIATPDWQRQWQENYADTMTAAVAPAENLVNDSWTSLARMMHASGGEGPSTDPEAPEGVAGEVWADLKKMNELHERIDATVKDRKTAEALKPWYYIPCKRITFNDEFLEAFNVPTVHLVDTDGQGPERITERGIIVAGVEYEVDCIIFASGFEVNSNPTRRVGFDAVGRDGARLSEVWADGMRTLHSIHVHGFPNAFLVQPATGAMRFSNVSHILMESAKTVAAIVAHAEQQGAEVVEATREGEDGWMTNVGVDEGWATFLNTECTPGYVNNEGSGLGDFSLFQDYLSADVMTFFRILQEWRAAGQYTGLEFR